MAQLGSPGVQVNVIDESFYNPAQPGTIPLIVLATAQDKSNASGTGIAPGTQAANANSLYLATSQKDLTDRFGVPVFQKDNSGNAIQGSELNEYGLFATYSYLGASNSAYILRAPVDLGALTSRSSAPVGNPAADSYWFDTASSRFGIFEWNKDSQSFVNKPTLVLNSANDVVGTSGGTAYQPKASIGVAGDYAIVTYSVEANPNDKNVLWFKNEDSAWVKVGSEDGTTFSGTSFTAGDWKASWPTVTSKAFTNVDVSAITYTSVSATGGDGTGATFNVTRNGTQYTSVTVVAGSGGAGSGSSGTGVNYVTGNVLTIPGTSLGGTSPTNDLTISLASMSGGGTIFNGNITPNPSAIAVSTSNLGMKITVGNYDRSGSPSVINYTVDGGASGSNQGVEASPTEIATQLNALLPSSVAVRVKNDKLEFIAQLDVYIKLEDPVSGTTLLAPAGSSDAAIATSPLGIEVGTYNAPSVQFSDHTKVPFWNEDDVVSTYPSGRPSGSLWIKTTEFNLGAKWVVKRFNGDTRIYETKSAPVYVGTAEALAKLDPLGGGANIPVNSLFVNANFEQNTDANFRIMYRAGTGATSVTTTLDANFVTTNETVIIAETTTGNATVNAVSIATGGTISAADFVALIQASALTKVTATYNATTRSFTLTHASGGEIMLSGTTWGDVFSGDETDLYAGPSGTTYEFRVSNWKPLSTDGYTVSTTQPTDVPADGTLWYAGYQNQVDIMAHNGTSWVGYLQAYPTTNATGPFVQATKPTRQTDGTALVENDLWVDTSDQDMYGQNIKRWNDRSKTWDAVTTTDHTSQFGIIYSDARWGASGDSTTAGSIVELLASNYVDFDAPDPTAYPRGMLLWNTRRSGFNIKQYKVGYVDTSATNPRQSDEPMTAYFADRWVSVSGQDLNQVSYFGRKAQRAYVVGQLKVAINTNQRILDEDNIFFNLIACPGYPELISDMVNLNNSRNGTALVVGDTPIRLPSDANSIVNYGTDYFNSGIDGEQGLHTNSDHLAVYYPSGLTTDLSGSNVVVPASHMMLRTIAISDQRSFQWFAPAGTRRGGVTNATSVGYLKDGSFIPVSLNQGTRDQMAQVKINPITNIPGAGLVAFGQYTKTGVNSSLDRINVARLVSYLRRQLGIITKPFLFEPNDKQTRSEIKNVCESLMLDLVSLRGVYDFIVVCDETNNTPNVISNNQLYVDIAVEPVKAVEFIYIPLRLKNVGDIKSRQ
jgi:hypothetical protein